MKTFSQNKGCDIIIYRGDNMIDLSMQSALLIYSTCFIVGFVFMAIFYYRLEKMNKSYSSFMLFFLLSSIGSLMIVFREDIGVFLSVITANTFLVIANLHLVHGIRKLSGLKSNIYLFTAIILLFTSIFIYFTYVDFQVFNRVIIYNLTIIGVLSYGVLSLKSARGINRISELMTATLVLIIVSMLFRIVSIHIFGESTNNFLQFQRDPFNVVLVGLANLLVVSGMLSMINSIGRLQLIESERSKTSLLSNLPGFAYRCLNDENWTMKYLSAGFEVLTEYKNEDIIDNNVMSFNDIVASDFRDQLHNEWNRAIENHKRFAGEYQILLPSGERVWVWEQGLGIYNNHNECIEIEGFITNINSRKNMERNLEFLSYRDSLTGLYNRRYIEEEIKRLEGSRNIPISIIIGDINGLKFINDSFGHKHGDEVIKRTAEILKKSLREYELVSRLGGDEFLMVLEDTSYEQTGKIVDRILNTCKKTEYETIGLSISLGFATKDTKEKTLVEVRKEAEDMMYKQKIHEKPSARRKAVDAVLGTLFEKDELSEIHSRYVSKLSKMLAKEAGLSQSEVNKAETAGLLHDVGKIIIDKSILISKNKLSKEEYEQIKKHPDIGFRILSNVSEFKDIANIILYHHERPDGTGYPNKVFDEEIPYISRIISICDAYEAMTHNRLYKKAISKEDAIKELMKNSGTQFDSKLLRIFIDMIKKEEKEEQQ